MSGKCKVCSDSRRAEIDASVAKVGTRKTAREFKISLPSLDRHNKHATARQLSAARTPEAVLSRLQQIVTRTLRKDDSERLEAESCIAALGAMIQHPSPEQKRERDLEMEIANLFAEATLEFDPQEIERLRGLRAQTLAAQRDDRRDAGVNVSVLSH